MNKKSIILIGIIVVLAIIVIFALTSGNGKNKNENVAESKISNVVTNTISTTNTVTNTMTNAIANTITNTITNVSTDERKNVQTNNSQGATVPPQSETFSETPATAEEKAIAIVKENWDGSQNVEFTIEGIDESGRYMVGVRDTNTTAAIAFYTVNILDGTFTRKSR